MHPIRTGRLLLSPFAPYDLAELVRFKADPLTWATMLGGIRTPTQTAEDLASELAFWTLHDVGMWTARDTRGALLGVTGLHERPDARGIALRFAFAPATRGQGYAREAAEAVLRDAHERGGLTRVVAAAQAVNIASRTVLGAIGMRQAGHFRRAGQKILLFESVRSLRSPSP